MTDIHHLRAFLAVAEELNFHRAAEKLGIVQPAISRSVRQLEEHLKAQLFERTTRHVRLTETGKVFVQEARAVLQQLAHAEKAARETEQGRAGPLNLAYMDFAVHSLLPNLVASIKVLAPSVAVQLTYMASAQQRLALIEGRIDAGIVIGEMSAPGIASIPLATLPLTVILRKSHRLCVKRTLSIADIREEDILLGTQQDWSAFRDIVFRAFANAGATPTIRHEASSAAALIGLVIRNLGITFYAGTPALYMNERVAVRNLQPRAVVPISLVFRRGPKQALLEQSVSKALLADTYW